MDRWTAHRSFGGLLAVALLAACTASSPAVIGKAFADQALAVCQSAVSSKHSWPPLPVSNFDPNHPNPSKLGGVAAWLTGVVAPTFEGWQHGLVTLGDPPSGQAEWAKVLDAVDRVVAGNEAQITAAAAGDPAAFATATTALQAAQPILVAATSAAGVAACADVHAS